MQPSGETGPGDDDSGRGKFHFPTSEHGGTTGATGSDDRDEPDTVLCRLPPADSDAVFIRLEAAGITCAGRRIYGDDGDVEVLVPEADLDIAQHAYDPPDDAEDDDDDPAEDAEFREYQFKSLIDAYICPECRRQTLNVVSRTGPSRVAREVAIALVVVPILYAIASSVFNLRAVDHWFDDALPSGWPIFYILLIAALFYYVVTSKRPKRCSACGWQTTPVGFPIRTEAGISTRNAADHEAADRLDELPPADRG